MGTAVSLDLRDGDVPDDALDAAFAILHDADARFSPFVADSEVSRFGRGELDVTRVSPDLRAVLCLCAEAAQVTSGAFDASAHRVDGRPDPTGLVKGWALQRAADALADAGARNFCLNGGGDIVARGLRDGRPWRVGIRHPIDPGSVALVLAVTDVAVATSAAYERGEHIVDPATGAAARALLSATVVGPDLALADAYATAIFVMGVEGVRWITDQPGYDAAVVTPAHRLVTSPGIDLLRV